jgi:2-hydroxy-3-keto-5-methylthiopentenyl-1-phosphate phosphatase
MPRTKRSAANSLDKLVVMCDFDGTITLQDTSEYILDKHARGDWRAFDNLLDRGEISIDECMNEQFALVNLGEEAIIKELDRAISIRPGFPELVEDCAQKGMEFYVVSAGLSFVIRHFIGKLCLGDKVRVVSPIARYDGRRIVFTFPPLIMPGSKSFKDDLVLRLKSGGMRVAFIGDGPPDAQAARIADLRFAVKGRKLESILSKEGLAHTSFEDFEQVARALRDR